MYHDGPLYVVARGAHQIYRIELNGQFAVFAGSGDRGAADGDAAVATFSFPNDIGVSPDGRVFYIPAERLALRYDDYDCRSLLSIEDGEEGLLRVAATAAEGRCRLEIWMPNNLNFQWLIDVEISVGARLYLAEMQRGQYASVLRKLIRSPEFEGLLQR